VLLKRDFKVTTSFKGGETQGLKMLKDYLLNKQKVLNFQKPLTDPTSLEPDTTALSPYLKFGSLSPRLFHQELTILIKANGGRSSQPPESLLGQLYWREFFYSKSYTVKGFDKMQGNVVCKQIPWGRDMEIVKKWEMG